MQALKSISDGQMAGFEIALRKDRLDRFMPPKSNNRREALRVYIWNCSLCEAFYVPLHFAEIATRNSIIFAVEQRLGKTWYADRLLQSLLDSKMRDALNYDIKKAENVMGSNFDSSIVFEGIRFCFWEHLTTKRFERLLWSKGVRNYFRDAPKALSLQELHELITSVRQWRNLVMHYGATHNKEPIKKMKKIITLISYSSLQVAEWVADSSRIDHVLRQNP